MNMVYDEFVKAWKESMRNETMEINHDNTSMYHEAYKRLRADYIPLASIDMKFRLTPQKNHPQWPGNHCLLERW